MAITENNYTGNGSKVTFDITFEYLKESDIKVSIDGTDQATTAYSFTSITTITFNTAPANGAAVRIYRDTNIDSLRNEFFAGSAIRAQDLNEDFKQTLFVVQELDNNTWDNERNTIHSDEAWVSSDDQIATTAALDARFQDEANETITSSETWVADDDHIATTQAIENRIDEVITSDIAGSDGISITDDGDGTITVGISHGSVDFDRIKSDDIITYTEQNAGSPSPADSNIFTALAAARRFDTLVQTSIPSGSDWEVGKTWFQNDADKTVSIWNGSSWEGVVSGGTFTKLDKVIYVDSVNGLDTNDGHRISTPKKTIGAALDDINSDSTYGDGSTILVSPGVYQETAPLDIQKKDVSIIGASLRNVIVHPTSATETNSLFRVNSGTYLQNMTFTGVKASGTRGDTGSLWEDSTYGLPPIQGWNVSFYPDAMIYKSPYIQNCTNFSDSEIDNDDLSFFAGTEDKGRAGDLDSAPTGGGLLVDGSTVHADSPLRSMVADSYTHVGLDGPGIFVTNNGYTQITSSYAFFNHFHIACINGGQANLAASTTDFGRYSLIADGKSTNAVITASINGTPAQNDTTFDIDNVAAGTDWHGSATRPQDNMLVVVDGVTYPVLGATAITGGWRVTISRPDTNDRTVNLGLSAAIADDTEVSFYLRSMIASSGHTMEYVGSGTDYTALPENGGVPNDNNQRVELNNGKIWTAITDHRGTFRVGDTFEVNQQTGFVNIPAGALSVSKLLENLDVNGNQIVSSSNGDIVINPDGTGIVELRANTTVTGNISVPNGTVDGRDVAADGTKLDGIEAGATGDQTAAEIKTAYESNSDTNAFTDAEKTKLSGIEANADVTDATNVAAAGAVMESDTTTASMSFVVDEDTMASNLDTKIPTQQSVKAYVDTSISNLVDSAPTTLDTLNELAAALGDDANFSTTITNSIATKLPLAGGTMTGNIVMSGAQTVDGRDLSVDGAKLDGIESGATADQTAAEIKTAYESNTNTNAFTDAEKTKLSGIAAGAEVNVQSDWNATSGDALILNKPTIPAAYTNSSVDTHLNTSTAATNEVLSWNGTDYDWVAQGSSPWTVSGSNVYYTSGNVGIGTTSPSHQLEVESASPSNTGGIRVSNVTFASNQDKPFLIAGTSNWTGANTNWNTYGYQFKMKSDSGGVGRMTIDVANNSANAEAIQFYADSKVNIPYRLGINYTSPYYALVVRGAAGEAAVGAFISQTANCYVNLDASGTTQAPQLGATNDDLLFRTSFSERMRIDSSGRVGIGTSSPNTSTKLHVAGSICVDNNSGLYGINSAVTSAYRIFHIGADDNVYINANSLNNQVVFQTGVNAERMRIDSSGNVGIGDTSPDVKLDIARLNTSWTGAAPIVGTGLRVHNGNNFTTSPAYIQLSGGSATDTGVYFGDEAASNRGALLYNHSDDSMRFNVSGSERLRIDSSGRLLAGNSSSVGNVLPGYGSATYHPGTQLTGTTYTGNNWLALSTFSTNTTASGSSFITLSKSNNATIGSHTAVNTNQLLGAISFAGSDGTAFRNAAHIYCLSGPTVGTNQMSGQLLFYTNDGGLNSTERLRIGSAGQIGLGGANYGTSGQVLTSNGSSSAPTWQDASGGNSPTLMTAVTLSATNWEYAFTNIPSWAGKIIVMFNKVTMNAAQNIEVRLGTSSGYITSNYSAYSFSSDGTNSMSPSDAFGFYCSYTGAQISGAMTITKFSSSEYCQTHNGIYSNRGNYGSGVLTNISGTIDRVKISLETSYPARWFTGGKITVRYEP